MISEMSEHQIGSPANALEVFLSVGEGAPRPQPRASSSAHPTARAASTEIAAIYVPFASTSKLMVLLVRCLLSKDYP